MAESISHSEWCSLLFESLLQLDVRCFVVCAGQRNIPLIEALAGFDGLEIFHHMQESAAAFFALGLVKSAQRPVAVVTTSGTAAAELLPACIEAYYSGLPLVLVTADRPKRYRGSGAPQAIEQASLFDEFVACSYDLDEGSVPKIESSGPITSPMHLNICLEEIRAPAVLPTDADADADAEKGAFSPQQSTRNFSLRAPKLPDGARPLVLVSTLGREEARFVEHELARLMLPVYAEAVSQLRESAALRPYMLRGGEHSLEGHAFNCIIRIGGVPTLRLWRDLEAHPRFRALPILSFSRLDFPGTSRQSDVFPLSALEHLAAPSTAPELLTQAIASDERNVSMLSESLLRFPCSEPALMNALSIKIASSAQVYLGNSLPIREWDLCASYTHPHASVFASRGANGIDGQISCFLGLSARAPETWGIVGDLTALYDLAAWFPANQLDPALRVLVVINNHGGRIFERISRIRSALSDSLVSAAVINPHTLHFSDWARMWGLQYISIREPSEISSLSLVPGHHVLEILPHSEETRRFWEAFEKSAGRG